MRRLKTFVGNWDDHHKSKKLCTKSYFLVRVPHTPIGRDGTWKEVHNFIVEIILKFTCFILKIKLRLKLQQEATLIICILKIFSNNKLRKYKLALRVCLLTILLVHMYYKSPLLDEEGALENIWAKTHMMPQLRPTFCPGIQNLQKRERRSSTFFS